MTPHITRPAASAFFNIQLLIWNLGQFARFKTTPAYAKLRVRDWSRWT